MVDAEKKREQEEAMAELEDYLNQTRPKNLMEGVQSGLGNVLDGALGAAGSLVLMPVVGVTRGYQKGGILGSTLGLGVGIVGGVVGAATSAAGGLVKGTAQVARGVISVPNSIIAPRTGKYWNDVEGKWVKTNLHEEETQMTIIPDDDNDIIGTQKADMSVDMATDEFSDANVKDTLYYETLGVSTEADQSNIKRQYYLLARKYHPDKVGDDVEAAEKFRNISEAYQVLSDPELRKIYDEEGVDGLTADKTSAAQMENHIDPTILFAFLFGSDKFYNYIGRLAVATQALVGDISKKDSRQLQKRRCTRIAIFLSKKLENWVHPDYDDEYVVSMWTEEAIRLSKCSFGYELVKLIGNVFSLSAVQYLGSLDSGIGMPSIAKWAKAQNAKNVKKRAQNKATLDTFQSAMNTAIRSKEAQERMDNAKTEKERQAIAEEISKDHVDLMLELMWTLTTVDVTSTLHEAIQMLLFDKSIDKKTSKKRAKGLKKLGEVFTSIPGDDKEKNFSELYEQAALAAMVETVKRKEDSAFRASFI